MAAMALITDPELVILDEPTTALDVTTQIEVLRAFRRVVRERQHDRGLRHRTTWRWWRRWPTASWCCATARMREIGRDRADPRRAADDYTQSLLAAARPAPRAAGTRGRPSAEPLLRGQRLWRRLRPRGRDGRPAVPCCEDIDLELQRGQALGVIGESGSGKTTLARVVAGLLPPATGTMLFDGRRCRRRSRQRTPRRAAPHPDRVPDRPTPRSTRRRPIERILARPLQFYHGPAAASRCSGASTSCSTW